MRNICIVTGTRSEYGLLKPVIDKIISSGILKLSLIVAGMHLSREFGYTARDIENDGIRVDAKVIMNPEEDTGLSMANAIGKGICGMAAALNRIKPDIIVVLGDRIEALSAVVAGAFMNIPIAHIHGGDSAKAGLDESVRHAITKFAHIHFPATRKSAERIVKMGEDKWRIFCVGAPGLDTILNKKLLDRKDLEKELGISLRGQVILLVQHPVTTEIENAEHDITETLEGVRNLGIKTIAIYPNSDAGGRKIIKKIKEYEKKGILKAYKSLSHKTYLSLLKHTSVMVGNSSSGIIESSSFGLPVVNIGIRQEGRERAYNVIDTANDRESIRKSVNKALSQDFKKNICPCNNPYGDGKAAERITKVLSEIRLDNKLIQKKLTY
ncbi:UDP-N-acetylglucosamine 2-epimerase (hydrolyzing) [Candidatus Woesearchaeota archaeon]|nr:UDP-N-acetylglucosamine 2-epimerase (hydrolyzing) [Candidatus Woesearchaeota archaeon]